MSKETKNESASAKPKGKLKRFLIVGLGASTVLGLGVGAGLYASGTVMAGEAGPKEDPNRPKLVERSKEPEAPAEGGEGGEEKAVPKVGTVSVKSDKAAVDPKRFEVTYFPIEQSFTANLADGSGFVQVGLSLATYYDGKVIANLQRQAVPVRSAILLVLSDQDATILSTPQGKRLLQQRLTMAINQVLREHEGFGGIHNVYFTNLVIQ